MPVTRQDSDDSTPTETPQVRHHPELHQYRLDFDGKDAVLRYQEKGGGVLDLYSTVTPADRRGQGAAGRLVTGALDQMRAKGQKVVPSCSYVRHFVDRHPEYQDLLV